jgi:predicted Zn-dependent peptidase
VLREFYKEKNVVMEERRMRVESQPVGRFLEEFLATCYLAHPYGTQIVGDMSDLEALSRSDAEAFFEDFDESLSVLGPNVRALDIAIP